MLWYLFLSFWTPKLNDKSNTKLNCYTNWMLVEWPIVQSAQWFDHIPRSRFQLEVRSMLESWLEEWLYGAVSCEVRLSLLSFSNFYCLLNVSIVTVPKGYKIVISCTLGMRGIYCTQPSDRFAFVLQCNKCHTSLTPVIKLLPTAHMENTELATIIIIIHKPYLSVDLVLKPEVFLWYKLHNIHSSLGLHTCSSAMNMYIPFLGSSLR